MNWFEAFARSYLEGREPTDALRHSRCLAEWVAQGISRLIREYTSFVPWVGAGCCRCIHPRWQVPEDSNGQRFRTHHKTRR
jgi:hypothetical protein